MLKIENDPNAHYSILYSSPGELVIDAVDPQSLRKIAQYRVPVELVRNFVIVNYGDARTAETGCRIYFDFFTQSISLKPRDIAALLWLSGRGPCIDETTFDPSAQTTVRDKMLALADTLHRALQIQSGDIAPVLVVELLSMMDALTRQLNGRMRDSTPGGKVNNTTVTRPG